MVHTAPSDYYLFWYLQNFLNKENRKFKHSIEDCSTIRKWLESRQPEFYQKGIYKLHDRWREIIELDGG